MSATTLIVAARTEEGSVGLFLVSADAQGLSRQAMQTDSRDYARVTLANVRIVRGLPGGQVR